MSAIETSNFRAEISDGKWYVSCKDAGVNMRELGEYAESVIPNAFVGDCGRAEWECDPAEMYRCKVTVQALLADAEDALATHEEFNGIHPDQAVWHSGREEYTERAG